MFTNRKNMNRWRLIGLCLFVALFWTSAVNAAETGKINAQQDKIPATFLFEGPLLAEVLSAAARTIQSCGCQNQVAFFAYERTDAGSHRLIIYLTRTTLTTPSGIWEEIPFRGTSLPAVLWDAARYMQQVGCEAAVRNVRYERQALQPNDQPIPVPVHVVYLVLESPSPC
ncbi:MAG TPA: hypothetical protein PLD25_06505 [Chloroflexota bacterium]|nr:hypothetical protein [Chloroflexota bacterium]